MASTEELVKAAQAGDTSAFAELVRRYERVAIITAQAILGDFHASQDAAQDAFVSAYQKLTQLRDAKSFGPWLLQTVRRRALRLQRARGAESPSAENPVRDVAEVAETAPRDWTEPYGDVVREFARLPEQERIVMVMRYVDGKSVKEIAGSTGRPVGTVTKQLSRAISRLRVWFTEVQL